MAELEYEKLATERQEEEELLRQQIDHLKWLEAEKRNLESWQKILRERQAKEKAEALSRDKLEKVNKNKFNDI